MPSAGDQRGAFFPKADAAVLRSKYTPPPRESRPTVVDPIFDTQNFDKPLNGWTAEVCESVYPENKDVWAPAAVPQPQACPRECLADRYLFPTLARNERLRLTMLFYYTHGALEDQELMSRLQEKVFLAKETVGWEFVIAGLLDHKTYTRLVTVGLPLALLPRRESTCAHTIQQPPGTIFSLLNMAEDWRFKGAPHVEEGGLRAYAGVPLRFDTEFGEHVAFGSLCVASTSAQEQLTKPQQRSLARLADAIVADIIHSARARRQQERTRMLEALTKAQKECDDDVNMEEAIPDLLRQIYPLTTVGIHKTTDGCITLGGGAKFKTLELQHGLWEDSEYFDYTIEVLNNQDMVAPKTVRVISAQCQSQRTPTFVVVESRDFQKVFDDIDSWFVHTCATILCRYWQSQALREATAAKENFLRGITHQLRTPIHGILGSVELLVEELKARDVVSSSAASSPSATPDAEQLDPYVYIKTIRTSARELIGTVNSLLKLNHWAKIAQAERVIVVHHISDIETALLNETTPTLSDDLAVRSSLVVQHKFPKYCDTIAIDMRLFLDCIRPLMVNAVQNTAAGVVALTLSLSEDYSSLIVDVEDNGKGISPKDHNRIFDAYEKIDPHTTEAGLGLTLACRAANLLNGNIRLVSSTLGQGSHFRATFSDPICASSLPRIPSLKRRFVHLPSKFHFVPVPAHRATLGYHLKDYLINHGYMECERPESTLLIIEYTPDLAQLHQRVTDISKEQVAICLLPDSARFIQFLGEQIKALDNVVYVRGPFLSTIFGGALERADSLLASIRASTLDSKDYSNGSLDLPLHRGSIFIQTELAQSMERSNIETKLASAFVTSSSRSRKPMTLLVDDNAINLRLLEMYCNRRGIPYRTAKDGRKAVQTFAESLSSLRAPFNGTAGQQMQTRPFDLILMDLQMPICDGIDASRQIRELEKQLGCKKSVLFIVTGQDSPSDRTDAKEAGSDGYLVKPVTPKVLDRWVERWFPNIELQ